MKKLVKLLICMVLAACLVMSFAACSVNYDKTEAALKEEGYLVTQTTDIPGVSGLENVKKGLVGVKLTSIVAILDFDKTEDLEKAKETLEKYPTIAKFVEVRGKSLIVYTDEKLKDLIK